jgi:UDP-N-acetylglucosamine 4-epimerase
VEQLLLLDQNVIGLDNFSNGKWDNLDQVMEIVGRERWGKFRFVEGDVRNFDLCCMVSRDVDFILHEASAVSVPRSLFAPRSFHDNNITGTLNMLMAARDCKVRRIVYASCSSVYGDHPVLPKVEETIGAPLSPYAVTQRVGELYADVFGRCYGTEAVGLRYFNVFGARQDHQGAYAAVIPKWIAEMMRGQEVCINGTGETSRDFCFVENVVQANILAATVENREAVNQVYNVAVGGRTTLNQLFEMIRQRLMTDFPQVAPYKPSYKDFRPGDIMHSHADISKARQLLGYQPTHTVEAGLDESLAWYKRNL